jgi:hypothetical protein
MAINLIFHIFFILFCNVFVLGSVQAKPNKSFCAVMVAAMSGEYLVAKVPKPEFSKIISRFNEYDLIDSKMENDLDSLKEALKSKNMQLFDFRGPDNIFDFLNFLKGRDFQKFSSSFLSEQETPKNTKKSNSGLLSSNRRLAMAIKVSAVLALPAAVWFVAAKRSCSCTPRLRIGSRASRRGTDAFFIKGLARSPDSSKISASPTPPNASAKHRRAGTCGSCGSTHTTPS